MNKGVLIEPQLEDSIVVFIDILGFKESLKDSVCFRKLFAFISNVKKQNKNSQIEWTYQDGQFGMRGFPALSSFSDCIVLSIAMKDVKKPPGLIGTAVNFLLGQIHQIADSLMYGGFILRGGLTRGELYHENGVVFGDALIDAYNLESKRAKTPRILVSKQLAEEYNTIHNPEYDVENNFLSEDKNGNKIEFYLDYMKLLFSHKEKGSEIRERFKSTTENKIKEFLDKLKNEDTEQLENNIKKLSKWLAYKKHVDKAISLYEKKPVSEIIEN